MLRYLVVHAGRLLTRDELRQAVWPDTHGSERAPKHCIRELRDVLTNGASLYLKKINNLTTEGIFDPAKIPGNCIESGFFPFLSVSISS